MQQREAMSDQDFLSELRQYIEESEVLIEADRGLGRSLERLVAEGCMPPVYTEALRRLRPPADEAVPPAKVLAEALMHAMGLQGLPIVEIELKLKPGDPPMVSLTRLLTGREVGLLVARLYRAQFKLEPAGGESVSPLKLDGSEPV